MSGTDKKYIIELGGYVSIPLAGMILADLDYEVIKIEPLDGEPGRKLEPPRIGDTSGYYASLNKNKRSVSLDLASEDGRNILYRLAEKSQAFITNLKRDTLAKMKIDYSSLKEVNPDLLYLHVVGFREGSQWEKFPAFDGTVMALSGLMKATGEKDGMPSKFPVPIADINSAMFITIMLLFSQLNGKRGYIAVPMLDTQIYLSIFELYNTILSGNEPERVGSAHHHIVPYRIFDTRDGMIFVAVASDRLFGMLCDTLKLERIRKYSTNDERMAHRDEVDASIQETLSNYGQNEAVDLLLGKGIPCAPVLGLKSLSESDYFQADLEKAERDGIRFPVIRFPVKNSASGRLNPPPSLGQDTEDILKDFGFTDSDIVRLRSEKTIR